MKRRFSITLPGESYHRLRGLAKQNRLSLNWVVGYAIERFLREFEEKQLPLDFRAGPARGERPPR